MDGLSTLGPDSGSFRLEYYTAAELVSALNSGKLVYLSKNPVQKWANDNRTQFIQSILFGLPQCEIMIDGSEQREIIFAGESQLHAIESFIGGRWRMKHAISSDASDREVGYNDLTLAAKLKIKNFKFSAIMINPGVSIERRVWIYYSQLSQKRWESMADCRERVFAREYQDIARFCEKHGCKAQEDLVWQFFMYAYAMPTMLRNEPTPFVKNLATEYYTTVMLKQFDKLFSTSLDFFSRPGAYLDYYNECRRQMMIRNPKWMECLMTVVGMRGIDKETPRELGRRFRDAMLSARNISAFDKTIGGYLARGHYMTEALGLEL